MPTTTPTARKQYGLRWLFAVTALVGILLASWRVYNGTLYTVHDKFHLLPEPLTPEGMEKAWGKPTRVLTNWRGGKTFVYPTRFNSHIEFDFNSDGEFIGRSGKMAGP